MPLLKTTSKKSDKYKLCFDLEYKKNAKENIDKPNGMIKRGKNLLMKKKSSTIYLLLIQLNHYK